MKTLLLARRRMSFVAACSLMWIGALAAWSQTIPKVIEITTPATGTAFAAPTNIQIIAEALDATSVIFMASPGGGISTTPYILNLGSVSNWVVIDPPNWARRAFMLTWSNAPIGTWAITAAAINSNGVTEAYSPQVVVTVGESNLAPLVRITSPPNNSVFRSPMNIPLLAYAHDPSGFVTSVQFFDGPNSLGFGRPVLAAVPIPPGPLPPSPVFQTNVFELIWSNAPAGSNSVTAVATDKLGLVSTSAPVNITVLPQTPPPTNKPAWVSIVATEPIAIEGTNCWPWLGLASTNGAPTWSNWVSPTALWHWFTNCGPQDATFTVCRAGATNNSLTVNYIVGGTASNGVDYAELPGVVTIPAGQMQATITVVPMDTQSNSTASHVASTVIIGLTPSANTAPDYVVGFPPKAEAVILDSASPHPLLTGALLGDRSFQVNATGPDGAWFRVDCTTNGLAWVPICTNQVVNGQIQFADPDAAGFTERFYRTVPLPNGPGN